MRPVLGYRFQRQFAVADIGDDFEFGPELAQLGLELRAQDRFVLGDDGSDWHW